MQKINKSIDRMKMEGIVKIIKVQMSRGCGHMNKKNVVKFMKLICTQIRAKDEQEQRRQS